MTQGKQWKQEGHRQQLGFPSHRLTRGKGEGEGCQRALDKERKHKDSSWREPGPPPTPRGGGKEIRNQCKREWRQGPFPDDYQRWESDACPWRKLQAERQEMTPRAPLDAEIVVDSSRHRCSECKMLKIYMYQWIWSPRKQMCH